MECFCLLYFLFTTKEASGLRLRAVFPVSHFWRILTTCFELPRIKANVDTRVFMVLGHGYCTRIPATTRIMRCFVVIRGIPTNLSISPTGNPGPPTNHREGREFADLGVQHLRGVAKVRAWKAQSCHRCHRWSESPKLLRCPILVFGLKDFFDVFAEKLSSFKMEGPTRISRIQLFSAEVKLYIQMLWYGIVKRDLIGAFKCLWCSLSSPLLILAGQIFHLTLILIFLDFRIEGTSFSFGTWDKDGEHMIFPQLK